ncbi:hypothetical protein HKCCSP123_13675, partial [Rhodobacterales bacterium HKCCSP123]|nr:hypothetical protein [Rhodobacterales bacterium HKCCSP123]
MTTYVLNGFSVTEGPTPGTAVFVSTTQLTVVISDEELIQYQYSDETNNPGFGELQLAGSVIPQAFFPPNDQVVPPDTNSYLSLSPYGGDENDEAYFFQVEYLDASNQPQTAVFLSIYDWSADVDHIFVLSSSDPNLQIPSTAVELAAFFGSLLSVSVITSGPFAPGVGIDLSTVFPATLDSTSDVDVWTGLDDDEFFDGGAGADNLNGAGGADVLVGGAGNDTLDGGTSTDDDGLQHVDAVIYSLEGGTNGVTVNLGTNSATDSFGNTDELHNIEGVAGTDFADELIGDANDNVFAGGAGNDTINGGDGIDEVDYEFLGQDGVGVYVDLTNGEATGSWGDTDTLISIENVFGSAFNDTIFGDGGDNVLAGGLGNDYLFGDGGDDYFDPSFGGGELDTVNGGEGRDTLRFFDSYLNENLQFTINPTGNATITNGTDTVIASGIEVLELDDASFELGIGTEGADTLSGSGIGAVLLGLGGDDVLTGTDNPDILMGGAGNDTLTDGAGDDMISGGDDNDLIIVTTGNDIYDGGDGVDTLRIDASGFAAGSFVYNLNLVSGYSGAQGNPVGADSVTGIEALELIGVIDSSVIGDANDNSVATGGGNDTIVGAAGNDTISGGQGFDSIMGDEGDDVIRGNLNADTIDGGSG